MYTSLGRYITSSTNVDNNCSYYCQSNIFLMDKKVLLHNDKNLRYNIFPIDIYGFSEVQYAQQQNVEKVDIATRGRCYDHNFWRFFPIFGEKMSVFLDTML
jgi:hypothetical protein